MDKKLVVFSGGIDSAVVLYDALTQKGEVETVSFDFGSKCNHQELKHSKFLCEKLGVKNTRIQLPIVHNSTRKKKRVGFLNGIMLSIATSLAENIGANVVVVGNNLGDKSKCLDTGDHFVKYMRQAMCSGTSTNVFLSSPFVEMTKTQVVSYGAELGVDWSLTYSCSLGGPVQCGRCEQCFERREAFYESGIRDVTEYQEATQFVVLKQIMDRNTNQNLQ